MPTIIQNLNSILTTKSELNSIIQENGYDPGEVFSNYPSYIRTIISSGGGGVSYEYLDEVLESYVTKDGLDSASYASKSYVADYVATYAPQPDLSAYVSKVELDSAGYISSIPSEYITDSELSSMSYASKSYVADYVATYAPTVDLSAYVTKTELNNASYITQNYLNNVSYATQTYVADYVAAHSGDITTDENLIPKAANTYTLGNNSYQYKCVYTGGIYLKPGDGVEVINKITGLQTKLHFVSTNDYLNISSNSLAFSGPSSSIYKLGWSSSPFYSTYTQKIYLGTANNGEEIRTIFPTYSYVADYVATYAPTPDLSAYVSKVELDAAGYISSIPNEYITDSELNSMSYATTTYVADYVAEHGGGSTVIDENIIPKENNTYTLGDASHLYSASYTKSTYFTNNTKIVGSSSDITFYTGGLSRVKINNNILRPDRSGVDLGSSSSVWATTYTSNLYTDTAYLQDTSYTKSIIPTETGTYTLGDANHLYDTTYTSKIQSAGTGLGIRLENANRYQFYNGAFRATDNNRNLGTSDYKWAATYTYNLYADTIHNFIWTGTSAQYAALSDYTTYQIYLIKES